MKLDEIFDAEYYDTLQQERNIKSAIYNEVPDDTQTSIQDFIITAYEVGKLTYQQALEKLKQNTPEDQLFFYVHELNMAQELKEN